MAVSDNLALPLDGAYAFRPACVTGWTHTEVQASAQ